MGLTIKLASPHGKSSVWEFLAISGTCFVMGVLVSLSLCKQSQKQNENGSSGSPQGSAGASGHSKDDEHNAAVSGPIQNGSISAEEHTGVNMTSSSSAVQCSSYTPKSTCHANATEDGASSSACQTVHVRQSYDENGEVVYVCLKCVPKFKTLKALRQHNQMKHESNRPSQVSSSEPQHTHDSAPCASASHAPPIDGSRDEVVDADQN